MDYSEILSIDPFSDDAPSKNKLMLPLYHELHQHHSAHSPEYNRIAKALFSVQINKIEDLPFLPVSLFKSVELKSIPSDKIYKTMLSSGTTGSMPSRIFLDAETAKNQTIALSRIMQFVLGKSRLPMLIVDTDSIIKNRKEFSARAAGVLGMSVFGKNHLYLLDEHYNLKGDELMDFLQKHKDQPILIFGFTFMVWQYLVKNLDTLHADFSQAILIHSGGWKKLIEEQVSNQSFKEILKEKSGLDKVYNFYGMVEQTGSIFLECEKGYLHAPLTGNVIIRNPSTLLPASQGEPGLIQVLSILPLSYPGFSILTEDIGTLHGEDNCSCGRKGRYFTVQGRAAKAELRGCSDTFAYSTN